MRAFLLSLIVLVVFAAPSTSLAQSEDGIEVTFYGYISPDEDTVISLGHLVADDPSLAAELVSPQYADDFFDGFTQFTDHEFAADLAPRYIDRIDEADEYMVFEGMLDAENGDDPGYLMFLSTEREVYVIFGYQDDAEDLFGLAAETIQAGKAPLRYLDFTRVALSEDGTVDESSRRRALGDGIYESPLYGYALAYDPEEWAVVAEDDDLEDDYDRFSLEHELGFVSLVGDPDYDDDEMARCVDEYAATLESDENVSRLGPVRGESGDAIGRAWAAYRYDQATNDADEPMDVIRYVECLALDDVTLVIIQTSLTDDYDALSMAREELLDELEES